MCYRRLMKPYSKTHFHLHSQFALLCLLPSGSSSSSPLSWVLNPPCGDSSLHGIRESFFLSLYFLRWKNDPRAFQCLLSAPCSRFWLPGALLFFFFLIKICINFYWNIFTMLCQFLLYRKMNLLHVYYIPPFLFPSHIGHQRALSRVPCAIQEILIVCVCVLSCCFPRQG